MRSVEHAAQRNEVQFFVLIAIKTFHCKKRFLYPADIG